MCCSTIVTSAQEIENEFDWSDVIHAISMVESRGNEKAYNKNGDCVGLLQITQGLVKECNRVLKESGSGKRFTNQDRWDGEKSKEMFILLQGHFNKENNVEKAIKLWNLGFYAKNWRNRGESYYKKVSRYLKKEGGD